MFCKPGVVSESDVAQARSEMPMEKRAPSPHHEAIQHERWELLRHIDQMLQGPAIILSFLWLGLLIFDLTHGLNTPLTILTYVIWAFFVADFLLEFFIAPSKLAYLRGHWITALALILPTVRVFAVFRALRALRAIGAIRSLGLVRLLTSLNRGMGALAATLGRRGVGFVIALTVIVIAAGAAGMTYFEGVVARPGSGIHNYWDGLWWTAMLMTTMGSEYWPKTIEGRILAFVLAVYAFTVFGYITATLASHFVRVDTMDTMDTMDLVDTHEDAQTIAEGAGRQLEQSGETTPQAGASGELAALRQEIGALRGEIATLTARLQDATRIEKRSP
jgi:voltage-gated potassium channel